MMKLNNEQTVSASQPAAAEIFSGDMSQPVSLSKFKDVESLCKAYSSLESEFTKRCQRIKELVGELDKLKNSETNANAARNEFIDKNDSSDDCINENSESAIRAEKSEDSAEFLQETGKNITKTESAIVSESDDTDNFDKQEKSSTDTETKRTKPSSEKSGGEELMGEIGEFFADFPGAAKCYGEISRNLTAPTKSGFIKAYIDVLESRTGSVKSDSEVYKDLSDNVKEMVIKEYLKNYGTEPSTVLMGGGGHIALTPPVRPKTLAEATALAKNIIKIK